MITGQERYFIVYELLQKGLSKSKISKLLDMPYPTISATCMRIEIDTRQFGADEYFRGREMAKALLLPPSVYCSLLKQEIYTIDDLVSVFQGKKGDFAKLRGIGPKTYSDLVERLSSLGYGNPAEFSKAPIPAQTSPDKWQLCLEYWDYRCAVCSSDKEIHQDHWVPKSAPECPGAEPTNMVPLCAQCNLDKSFTGPYVWLVGKIGQIQAQAKMIEVFEYFDWWREKHAKG